MRNVSIVIPVRNEEKNIVVLVEKIITILSKAKITYEIICIDDHSSDKTVQKITALQKKFPISVYTKQGKRGKAFSLVEGFAKAKYPVFAMIDADLQYPPEVIPNMVRQIEKGADIVVVNRKNYKTGKVRETVSTTFRNIFAKKLFGLDHDVQAGLKVFTREAYMTLAVKPASGWTFDLEFLHRAKEAGFRIQNHDITFEKRENGDSKISLLTTSIEIGFHALLLRLKRIPPVHLISQTKESMRGAGIGYKKRQYITHSTLHHTQSAIQTFIPSQRAFIAGIVAVLIIGIFMKPLLTFSVMVAILSFIYFLDVFFNLYLILKSLHVPQEISFTPEELTHLQDKQLPLYSILCPLYKEAHVIPQFLANIAKLDYPKNKLDVMLLLEEDDTASITAVNKMDLPSYVRIVVVPDSLPKTKPKACNYGLSQAKGEYMVIYDAEDDPDPLQLKKAYLGFQKVSKNTLCLQAKLNYYNPHQNMLTRFFTAEYSLWFDVTLTGLQSINTTIPLGGTSNHFKTKNIKQLEGWDPFNVTEDADLGIRLFKKGYKTAIIDSVTLEEANSKWGNWVRQRSRWIKGYMQTYLVHTRSNWDLLKKTRHHAAIFHLVIGGKIAFILINPLLWLLTISYFTLYAFVGPAIEAIYPSVVFYMAATSLVFGNFLFLYYYMVGCAKRDQWSLMKYVYLIPVYWLMISVAGVVALYQLIFKPHYWEKTIHGLHLLGPLENKATKKETKEKIAREYFSLLRLPVFFRKPFTFLFQKQKGYIGSFILICSTVLANIINYVFTAYIGRQVNFEDLALISLINSFFYLSSIPFGALLSTYSYRSAYIDGKEGKEAAFAFLNYGKKKIFFISIALSLLWVCLSPLTASFFHTKNEFPILLFTPVWLVGALSSMNRGFIFGTLMFSSMSLLYVFEPVIKLLTSFLLINTNLAYWVFTAIPLSYVAAYLLNEYILRKKKFVIKQTEEKKHKFPVKFFFVALLSGLSSITFLSLDVILANHFLPAKEAGKYALVSVIGKTIYLLGGLFAQFLGAFVSKKEGEGKNSLEVFYKLFAVIAFFTVLGFIGIGLLGNITLPILFGSKVQSILVYLPVFSFAVLCFTLANQFVYYQLARSIYTSSFAGFFLAIVQVILISFFHSSVMAITHVMGIIGSIDLVVMVILFLFSDRIRSAETNIREILANLQSKKSRGEKLKILIFNWRDTKHKWAGGAEVYVHELAKKWVADGNHVTLFCGNDGKNPRNEVIDGVQIVRRGGFYTVYVWAFLYYVLSFKGLFDVIVDSENGIPFFTPLYSRAEKFLLIHHVHQEVFRKSLRWPLSAIALFLEAKLMPLVYRDTQVITVSPSSKEEILKHKLTKKDPIIIYNGVDLELYKPGKKHKTPLVLYVGRIQYYKSLNVFIYAAKKIKEQIPSAKFIIAGEGEERENLEKLCEKINLKDTIVFMGKVSEKQKIALFQKAWVFVNPSFMEGWGITTIEANACATPAIASNVPGLRDSIKHGQTGILVPYGKASLFAEEIIKLINDTELRKNMSNESLEWSKNFTWYKSAQKFYLLLKEKLLALQSHSQQIAY